MPDPTGKTDATRRHPGRPGCHRDQRRRNRLSARRHLPDQSPADSPVALRVQGDHVVLRGAGTGKTFLFTDSTQMREKRLIEVKAAQSPWVDDGLQGGLQPPYPGPASAHPAGSGSKRAAFCHLATW